MIKYTAFILVEAPSLLDITDLQLIFTALRNDLFLPDIETTLEANPDDITDLKLTEWRTVGINRLSVASEFCGRRIKMDEQAYSSRVISMY